MPRYSGRRDRSPARYREEAIAFTRAQANIPLPTNVQTALDVLFASFDFGYDIELVTNNVKKLVKADALLATNGALAIKYIGAEQEEKERLAEQGEEADDDESSGDDSDADDDNGEDGDAAEGAASAP